MRSAVPLAVVVPAVAVLALLAGPVDRTVGPTSAGAAEVDACAQKLDPERRAVYRFRNGDRTLRYGRVVVTATTASPNRFCIRVDLDGRTLLHRFSMGSDIRKDDKWVVEGGLGDSGYRTESYTFTQQIRPRTRQRRSYGVKVGGRWYDTVSFTRTNL